MGFKAIGMRFGDCWGTVGIGLGAAGYRDQCDWRGLRDGVVLG